MPVSSITKDFINYKELQRITKKYWNYKKPQFRDKNLCFVDFSYKYTSKMDNFTKMVLTMLLKKIWYLSLYYV